MAYLIALSFVLLLGVAQIPRDFPLSAVLGFPTAVIGALHLVAWFYGRTISLIRRSSELAGIAFVALAFWIGGMPDDWTGRSIVLGVLVCTGLSMASRAPRGPSATLFNRKSWSPRASSIAYLVTAGCVAAVGMVRAAADFWTRNDLFDGLDVLIGFSYLLVGGLNLLNWHYGPDLRVMRSTAIAVNVAFVVILWLAGLVDSGQPLEQLTHFWLPGLMMVLAVSVSGLERVPAASSAPPGADV